MIRNCSRSYMLTLGIYLFCGVDNFAQNETKSYLDTCLNIARQENQKDKNKIEKIKLEVSVKDGKLMMNADGQEGEIKPMSEEDKFDADGKATILFIRDEKKKVIKLKMEAMGFSFDGVKE